MPAQVRGRRTPPLPRQAPLGLRSPTEPPPARGGTRRASCPRAIESSTGAAIGGARPAPPLPSHDRWRGFYRARSPRPLATRCFSAPLRPPLAAWSRAPPASPSSSFSSSSVPPVSGAAAVPTPAGGRWAYGRRRRGGGRRRRWWQVSPRAPLPPSLPRARDGASGNGRARAGPGPPQPAGGGGSGFPRSRGGAELMPPYPPPRRRRPVTRRRGAGRGGL